ncbi:hypothetical protein [Mycobacterium sp.]|uniref:hypothetical protein n=1 Tax=Mycobacterium sp. TaxID=1785 RepID=UPI002CF2E45F|nr:hypothetical protein [Mycobacterium sp.]HTY35420.1 hypothetical protein [Mycobacterium sp.]
MPGVESFRLDPLGPPQAYRTVAFARPLTRDFWRPASCADVDCEHYLRGWATKVLPGSADEAAVRGSGRAWSAVEKTEDGFLRFMFPPGQACFRASTHRVPVEREPIWFSRNGDHRADLGGHVRHTRVEHWVEELAEQSARITDAVQRG